MVSISNPLDVRLRLTSTTLELSTTDLTQPRPVAVVSTLPLEAVTPALALALNDWMDDTAVLLSLVGPLARIAGETTRPVPKKTGGRFG